MQYEDDTQDSATPERTPETGDAPLVVPPAGVRAKRAVRRAVKSGVQSLGKRSNLVRKSSRWLVARKRWANYAGHLRRTPVDDKTILFESFMGRSYSCSPKALYRAMLADPRFDDFTFIWAFKRPTEYAEHPDFARATLVRYHSQLFYEGLARARWWVTNSVLPAHVWPRENQALIQTWHGTPLKRLGCDIEVSASANALYSAEEIHERYKREGRRLTWLLSPSRFATEKFASAFDLISTGRSSAIVEEGYPRNDYLSNFDSDDVARIKAELGIAEHKKVILYAPTWRDNQHTTGVGYTLELGMDFDALRRELGEDYVVLFRAHYFVANAFDFERHAGFVFDVSGVDDINELYVVSDMLVTDYSSVFFDYGNLKRPIIFYMYDLGDYTVDIRGFYLDLADLPGPVVTTESELVDAIKASESPNEASIRRYDAFSRKYTYLDDGRASERVIERCIGSVVYHESVASPDRSREGAGS